MISDKCDVSDPQDDHAPNSIDEPATPGMHPALQFLIGAAIGVMLVGIAAALAMLGIDAGLVMWLGVFAVVWIVTFIALRRRFNSMLAGMMLTILVLYMVVRQYLLSRG